VYTNEAYTKIVGTDNPNDGINNKFLSIKSNDENLHPADDDRQRLYSILELVNENPDFVQKHIFISQLQDVPEDKRNRHYLINKQTFVYNSEESLLILLRDVTEFSLLE
jgi:hypothetical protein